MVVSIKRPRCSIFQCDREKAKFEAISRLVQYHRSWETAPQRTFGVGIYPITGLFSEVFYRTLEHQLTIILLLSYSYYHTQTLSLHVRTML